MKELLNNPGFVALVGTLFGGAGLKAVEGYFGRAKERSTEEASLREELRKNIADLRTQLDRADAEELRLETSIDDWREKYYALRDEHTKIVTELTLTLQRLKDVETHLDPNKGI